MLRSVKLRQKKHPRPAETSRRSLGDERARPWYHPALPPAGKNPFCAACGLYQVRKPYPAPFTERVRRSLRRKKACSGRSVRSSKDHVPHHARHASFSAAESSLLVPGRGEKCVLFFLIAIFCGIRLRRSVYPVSDEKSSISLHKKRRIPRQF